MQTFGGKIGSGKQEAKEIRRRIHPKIQEDWLVWATIIMFGESGV
jgi:hypothetical protein